jgi:HD-GYP domain-containing protein (c-di-GMP phosphodiesterase class II)
MLFPPSKKSLFPLPAGPAETPEAAPDPWALLETLMEHLAATDDLGRQLRLVLEGVRQGTRADVVFLCSGPPGRPVECIGQPRPDPDWCRDFVRRLLRATPGVERQLLRSHLPAEPGAAGPQPVSAALVRFSRSRQAWLAALSFNPERRFEPEDVKLMSLARRLLTQRQQQAQVYDRLREALFALVGTLAATLDARDPYTWGHSERVARIGVRLARQMGLPESAVNDLYLGGLLHDIGKIGVRDDVLGKPGPLTPEERLLVQQHTVIGDGLLAHVRQLAHLRPCVRNHHEQYDGQGYPDGLAGDAIPLAARILAVADSCDAMMSDRPYRKCLPPEKIDAIFADGSGKQWDPDVVRHFLACRQELYVICQRGLGDSVVKAVEQTLRAGAAVDNQSVLVSRAGFRLAPPEAGLPR